MSENVKIDEMSIDKPILPEDIKGGAGCVYVDPPWDVHQKGKRGAAMHYNLMTLDQIKKLPVGEICKENAHCWLCVTNGTMESAFKILRGWGFEPKSIFTWYKPRLGLGVYLRNCTEHIILGVKGKQPILCKNQPNIGIFPVQDHSHKPEEIYSIIRRCSPGPYVELFARRPEHGFKAWGNQIASDIMLPGYPVPEYSDELKETIKNMKSDSQDKQKEVA